jgi:hypothetical protein
MEENEMDCPPYLFIAFSRRRWSNDGGFQSLRLARLAEEATREAGHPCFWLSDDCVFDLDKSGERHSVDVSDNTHLEKIHTLIVMSLLTDLANRARYPPCREADCCPS